MWGGGGKLLHGEIYQHDFLLSENKIGLLLSVEGPYLHPKKNHSRYLSNGVMKINQSTKHRICKPAEIGDQTP